MNKKQFIALTYACILLPIFGYTQSLGEVSSIPPKTLNPFIIPSLFAILGVIIQLIIGWQNRVSLKKLARRQYQDNLNSKNRQEWINDVRHSLSEFLAQAHVINLMLQTNPQKNQYDIIPHFEKIAYHQNKLAMFLVNRQKDEDKHNDMLNLLEQMKNQLNPQNKTYTYEKFMQVEQEITSLASKLIKTEWDKIKSEEKENSQVEEYI